MPLEIAVNSFKVLFIILARNRRKEDRNKIKMQRASLNKSKVKRENNNKVNAN